MTTQIHIRRTFLAVLAMLGALTLAAGAARADFEPSFEVTQDGTSSYANATVDSAGGAHFAWVRQGAGVQTRSRAADGALGPVRTLDSAGTEQQLAADAAGNVHFVWRAWNGANYIARTRIVRSDGTLGQTVDLSSLGFNAYEPHVAVDAAGGVTFTWKRTLAAGSIIQARRMAPDGTLGQVHNISLAGGLGDHQLAVDAAGNAAIVWSRNNGSYYVGEARRWSADGSLGQILEVTTTGAHASQPQVAFDGSGNAYFAVVRGIGLLTRRLTPDGALGPAQDVRVSVADTARDPALAVDADGTAQIAWRAVSITDGDVIQTLRRFPNGSFGGVRTLGFYEDGFVAAPRVAFDAHGNAHHAWITPIGEDAVVMSRAQHADGSLGSTQELTHALPGAGGSAHRVTLATGANGRPVAAWTRAKDPAEVVEGALLEPEPSSGTAAGTSTGIGTGASTSAGTGEQPDMTPPELSALALRPGRLAVGQRGRVDYTLSEAANVRLWVARRGAGRRVRGRCVRATARNRSRRRCDLRVDGALGQRGRAGANRLTFPGRLRGRYLRPGRYVLMAVAADVAGNTSERRRAAFRVVRRRR